MDEVYYEDEYEDDSDEVEVDEDSVDLLKKFTGWSLM